MKLSHDLKRILKNIGWLTSDKVVKIILKFVISIFVVRYLGADQFGKLNYALSISIIVFSLSDLGLNGIVVNEILKHKSKKGPILSTVFSMKLLSTFMLFGVLAAAVFLFFEDRALRMLVIIFSVGLTFKAFDFIDYYFQSEVRSKYTSIARLIAFAISISMRVFLIIAEADLLFFALAATVEILVQSLLYLYFFKKLKDFDFKLSFDKALAKQLLGKSWPLILSGVSSLIYLKVDQVMLGIMRTNSEVGTYAIAAQFSEVWFFLPQIIGYSFFPKLIENRKLGASKYEKSLKDLYALMLFASLALIIVVSLASPFAIPLIYGEQFRISSFMLMIHIWATAFIFLRAVTSKWLIMEGLYKFSLVTHGSGAISNILLNLFLIPRWGGIGASIATVLSYACASYFSLYFNKKTRVAAKNIESSILGLPILMNQMFKLLFNDAKN